MYERGIAIVALTKHGIATAARIARGLKKIQIRCVIYSLESIQTAGITPFDGDLKGLFAKLFVTFDGIIAVMAVGIVVRSIAPIIADKKIDPAVVVIDDLGKYAVSLLSGHIGGANRLTKIVAAQIGAIPVVTTATDLLGLKSVEEVAEEHGLKVVNPDSLTPINSAIVNGRKILFATIDHVSNLETDVYPPLPIASIDELERIMKDYDAGILIAPKIVSLEKIRKPVALLTPKSKPLATRTNQ